MKNKKEEWIDKMFSEATEVEIAFHSKEEVFDKIRERLNQPNNKNNIVSFRQFRLAGAAAIAILALNIAIITYTRAQSGPNKETNTVYKLSSYNLDLY